MWVLPAQHQFMASTSKNTSPILPPVLLWLVQSGPVRIHVGCFQPITLLPAFYLEREEFRLPYTEHFIPESVENEYLFFVSFYIAHTQPRYILHYYFLPEKHFLRNWINSKYKSSPQIDFVLCPFESRRIWSWQLGYIHTCLVMLWVDV